MKRKSCRNEFSAIAVVPEDWNGKRILPYHIDKGSRFLLSGEVPPVSNANLREDQSALLVTDSIIAEILRLPNRSTKKLEITHSMLPSSSPIDLTSWVLSCINLHDNLPIPFLLLSLAKTGSTDPRLPNRSYAQEVPDIHFIPRR